MDAMKKKVLVIDDSKATLMLFEGILGDHPEYDLIGPAQSGEEGIKLFKLEMPDLVCLDVLMPGLGGLEVLRTIRTLAPEAKVLIISALGGSVKTVESFLEAGASGILAKPFDEDALMENIRRLIGS